MSRNRLGVAAAVILSMLAVGATTSAAQKKPKDAAAAGAITEKDRERGKAEAPALAKSAGIACTVADARFIIASTDPKTKVKTDYFEIACDQGMGYLLIADASKPAPTGAPCFEANKPIGDKPSPLACKLPGNLDLQAQLTPYIAKTGKTCVVEKSRYIGASPAKTFIEVACQGGNGYILETAAPANIAGETRLNSCLNYEAGQTVACELTDRAAQLAVVDKLMAGSGKACTVKDRRYVLSTKDGASWFEAACEGGTGFMIEQKADGTLARALACADADFVGGGCTMTDARAAKTEQNGLYTKLSGNAGFKCTVEQYGVFNVPNKEIVELKCSDRPDGGIAEFKGSGGIVYNCALAEVQGYRCSFTKKDASYAQVTKDLRSLKDTTCNVRETRTLDRATDNAVYMEANCDDGNGSYVIGYQRGGVKPLEVLSCAQAKTLGGCKLPGNK
ncbi:hypothetical protein GVN21_15570 [Caulobacter sp. SLTY]|uniref:hypothetical protein n=1 Tax=Caulobacter sp. SLTY TaxID=2683262 RepID=UPI0014132AD2|nr:hypothetical protein [Caulobacter sp. SLTY]NBB16783.1 hypothetical protein [Caulobacter sp. SLTY]